MIIKCANCYRWDDKKSFRFDFAKAMPCTKSDYGYASSDQSVCKEFKPKALCPKSDGVTRYYNWDVNAFLNGERDHH